MASNRHCDSGTWCDMILSVMDVETVIKEIKKLSPEEQREVADVLRKSNGEHSSLDQSMWKTRVDENYGVMKDDPISRGDQVPPQKRPGLK